MLLYACKCTKGFLFYVYMYITFEKNYFFKTTIDFGIQLHYSSSQKDFDLIKKNSTEVPIMPCFDSITFNLLKQIVHMFVYSFV